MESRQVISRVPTRPIVLVMAFLSVFAVGLTGWYVVASTPASHPAVTRTSGFPGPDAVERNQQLTEQHNPDPNSTHGH